MFTDQGTFPSTAGDGMFYDMTRVSLLCSSYMTQGAGSEEQSCSLRGILTMQRCRTWQTQAGILYA